MPPVYKEQTQLLIAPHLKTRLEALALLRDESQADVSRWLIEAALPMLENSHSGQLSQLREALEAMGVDYSAAVHAMFTTKPRIRLADLLQEDGAPRMQFPGVIR